MGPVVKLFFSGFVVCRGREGGGSNRRSEASGDGGGGGRDLFMHATLRIRRLCPEKFSHHTPGARKEETTPKATAAERTVSSRVPARTSNTESVIPEAGPSERTNEDPNETLRSAISTRFICIIMLGKHVHYV